MYTWCQPNMQLTEVTDKQHKKTLKPNCAIKYNKRMGEIDLQDQILVCFPIMKKFLKGYRKLFLHV